MIKMLASILLNIDSGGKGWVARDVIISEIFEIFKSPEMLSSFQIFFEDNEQDHVDGKALDPKARWQMCEPECQLTTANDEQLYEVRNA